MAYYTNSRSHNLRRSRAAQKLHAEPPSASDSAAVVWRGRSGREILLGKRMAPQQLKELQKDLGLYSSSRRVNRAVFEQLQAAVIDDLKNLLRRGGAGDGRWPLWTQRWFLDPTWDGDDRPSRQPCPLWVTALWSAWAGWNAPERQCVFALLRLLDHHGVEGQALLLLSHAMDAYIKTRCCSSPSSSSSSSSTTTTATAAQEAAPPPPPSHTRSPAEEPSEADGASSLRSPSSWSSSSGLRSSDLLYCSGPPSRRSTLASLGNNDSDDDGSFAHAAAAAGDTDESLERF
ncbi:hypothetical protein IWX47DRAFT_934374 [Phyllosticta citricarpa]